MERMVSQNLLREVTLDFKVGGWVAGKQGGLAACCQHTEAGGRVWSGYVPACPCINPILVAETRPAHTASHLPVCPGSD